VSTESTSPDPNGQSDNNEDPPRFPLGRGGLATASPLCCFCTCRYWPRSARAGG